MGRFGVAIRGSHSSSRCAILIVIVIVSAQAVFSAEESTSGVANCIVQIEHEVPVFEPITIYLTDSSVVRGFNPIVSRSAGVMYLRPVTNSGMTTELLIPFDRIQRLTFEKTSPTRGMLSLVGFVTGAYAGGALAIHASSSTDFMDFQFGEAILGGLIGGTIGALAGSELGKHLKITVTLRCM